MKKIARSLALATFVSACMTLGGYAVAADAGQPQNFQKRKQHFIELQQQSISILQQGLVCLKSAADMQAVRRCHMQERSSIAQLREKARSMFPRAAARRQGGYGGGNGQAR